MAKPKIVKILVECERGHPTALDETHFEHQLEGRDHMTSEHCYLEWVCEACRTSIPDSTWKDIAKSIRL